jgi:hypothetical protein
MRRWVTAAGLTIPLMGVYGSVGPSWVVGWAVPAALLCAVAAAVVLASYVPQPGSDRWLEVGCSPCAVMGGATVVGSLLMRSTAPLDPGIAVVAFMLLVFGLVQRLRDTAACAVPVPIGRSEPEE